MGILSDFIRDRKLRSQRKKDLSDKIIKRDYESVGQILKREINLGDYSFVAYGVKYVRFMQNIFRSIRVKRTIDLPENFFEGLLEALEKKGPSHRIGLNYRRLKTLLKYEIDLKKEKSPQPNRL